MKLIPSCLWYKNVKNYQIFTYFFNYAIHIFEEVTVIIEDIQESILL